MNLFQFLFSAPDYSSNDKLGAYPEKVHVAAMPERRYLKATRFLALFAAGAFCVTIVLCFILYMLVPQIRPIPEPLFVDKRLYRLEPVQRNVVATPANILLLETHVKEYVMLRTTIIPDMDEFDARWANRGPISLFSEKSANAVPDGERKKNLMREGLVIETNIHHVDRITNNLWTVEFDTIEHMQEEDTPTIKRWRATLEAGFMERKNFSKDEKIRNPLGFTVMQYHLSSRGAPRAGSVGGFQD